MTTTRIPVVLHAHFYQPPRDNPWTEAVEREASAAPFHDWNERILAECYAANAAARVFGDAGLVADIVNNYAYLSFNVGPTLFGWLEAHAPQTYRRIVEADRESAMRNDGHGNAIAQAYSHAILPLCNERDRETQVRWGLADFRRRFRREPEAMWLPETACDLATADALARHGMRYLILSPHQAARVRPIGAEGWLDVADGSIDPRRPYRLALPQGRGIACFFYDGPAAHAVSFEAVLDTSRALADRLLAAAGAEASAGGLVHIATDGETYGHHHRFADRALAFFATHEAPERGLELTNYAAYLDRVSVTHEVELQRGPMGEGTAWSCAHGLGRWSRDCGCNAGRGAGWTQAWRAPLRRALDLLREHAADVLEGVGSDLLRDPWMARDAYIEVILDPSQASRDAFLKRHARGPLHAHGRVRALELLEAHRMTQLMYASCGWFFDDLAGLETVQVLEYAARATQLLEDVSGHGFMPALLEALAEARSNLEAEGNGADVMRRRVLPSEVTTHARTVQRVSRLLFDEVARSEQDAAFAIETLDNEVVARGSARLVVGRARVTRVRTQRADELTYAGAALTERDMHAGVRTTVGRGAYEAILQDAEASLRHATPTDLIRLIDRHLGPSYWSAGDLGEAARGQFMEKLVLGMMERLGALYGFLFDEHRRVIEALESAGAAVPEELRLIAEYTLARRLDQAVSEARDSDDPDMFRSALEVAREAKRLGVRLQVPRSVSKLAALVETAARGLGSRRDAASAQHVIDLVELTRSLGLEVPLDAAQDVFFDLHRRGAFPVMPVSMERKLADAIRCAVPPRGGLGGA
jgi:alpha-amylase/alpha-mannosidase (GH57 family)